MSHVSAALSGRIPVPDRQGQKVSTPVSNAESRSLASLLAKRGLRLVLSIKPEEAMSFLNGGNIDLIVAGEDLPGEPSVRLCEPANTNAATRDDPRVEAVRRQWRSLTHREDEVLGCVVRGLPNKVIAHELSISPRTVENHRKRVMIKMGATSVAELVRMTLLAGKR